MFTAAVVVTANSWHLITLQKGIQGVTVILFSDVTYEFIKQKQKITGQPGGSGG